MNQLIIITNVHVPFALEIFIDNTKSICLKEKKKKKRLWAVEEDRGGPSVITRGAIYKAICV